MNDKMSLAAEKIRHDYEEKIRKATQDRENAVAQEILLKEQCEQELKKHEEAHHPTERKKKKSGTRFGFEMTEEECSTFNFILETIREKHQIKPEELKNLTFFHMWFHYLELHYEYIDFSLLWEEVRARQHMNRSIGQLNKNNQLDLEEYED